MKAGFNPTPDAPTYPRTRYMATFTPSDNNVTGMSSKSLKPKSRANSIDEKDAAEIIAGVQAMYDKVPRFFRPMLPALPEILRRIPASAGKYTLADIIQLLDQAYESGRLKR